MTVTAGQLRRWKQDEVIEGFGGEHFIVVRRMGVSYMPGARIGEDPTEHWEVLCSGKMSRGWSTPMLEDASEEVQSDTGAV